MRTAGRGFPKGNLMLKAAGLGLMFLTMTACASSVDFDTPNNTRYLTSGTYSITVTNECGTPQGNVAGQITGNGWSYPLLSGTHLAIPASGDYTVFDPVGWDLMGTPPPACALEMKVSLTPIK